MLYVRSMQHCVLMLTPYLKHPIIIIITFFSKNFMSITDHLLDRNIMKAAFCIKK